MGSGESRSNAAALVLAALVALSLTSASTTAGSAAAPGWLVTQTATHGTLEPAGCPCRGRFILTLWGANAQMVWFADRPARGAGQLTVRASGVTSTPTPWLSSCSAGRAGASPAASSMSRCSSTPLVSPTRGMARPTPG